LRGKSTKSLAVWDHSDLSACLNNFWWLSCLEADKKRVVQLLALTDSFRAEDDERRKAEAETDAIAGDKANGKADATADAKAGGKADNPTADATADASNGAVEAEGISGNSSTRQEGHTPLKRDAENGKELFYTLNLKVSAGIL